MSESSEIKDTSCGKKAMEELNHFLDVPVKVDIRLANRTMKVRDILQLQPNSVVELSKSAGESVDILINDRLIAFGEILELEDRSGVLLTGFSTPAYEGKS